MLHRDLLIRDRMLQNRNVPENSQLIGAGMPGEVTWGVIGGGGSARRFAAGLTHVIGARLTSVWTRKREVAEACRTPQSAVAP